MGVRLELHLPEGNFCKGGIFYRSMPKINKKFLQKGARLAIENLEAVVTNYDSENEILFLAPNPQADKGKTLGYLLASEKWKMVGADGCSCHSCKSENEMKIIVKDDNLPERKRERQKAIRSIRNMLREIGKFVNADEIEYKDCGKCEKIIITKGAKILEITALGDRCSGGFFKREML